MQKFPIKFPKTCRALYPVKITEIEENHGEQGRTLGLHLTGPCINSSMQIVYLLYEIKNGDEF